ncbi:Os02g0226400, partial [Oryza sativa Japonica Group]
LFRCQAHRPPPLRAIELVACLLSATPSLSARLPDLHRRGRGRAGVERKRGKATTGRGAATSSSSPPPLFLAPGERNVEHRRGFLPTATPVAAHFLRLSAATSLPSAGRERIKERERRDGK